MNWKKVKITGSILTAIGAVMICAILCAQILSIHPLLLTSMISYIETIGPTAPFLRRFVLDFLIRFRSLETVGLAAGLAMLIARAQKLSGNNRKFRSAGIILVAVGAVLTVTSMILFAVDTRSYSSVVWLFAVFAGLFVPLIFAAGWTTWLLSAKSGKKIRNIGIILVVIGIVFYFLLYFLLTTLARNIILFSSIICSAALVDSGEMLLVAYGLLSKDKNMQKNFWHCTCGAVNKTDDLFCSDCGAPKPIVNTASSSENT